LFGDESICASADHKYRPVYALTVGASWIPSGATAARETSKNAAA